MADEASVFNWQSETKLNGSVVVRTCNYLAEKKTQQKTGWVFAMFSEQKKPLHTKMDVTHFSFLCELAHVRGVGIKVNHNWMIRVCDEAIGYSD